MAKRKPFKTLLAFTACLSLSPVDADPTTYTPDVQNVINSISGLLGGNFGLNQSLISSTGSAVSSTGNTTLFGGAAPSTIYGIDANGKYNNLNAAGAAEPIGQATPPAHIPNNNPAITSYNLYGSGGLFNQLQNATGYNFNANGNNIYYPLGTNTFNSTVNGLLGEFNSVAKQYFDYRSAFSGVNASNNLTSPTPGGSGTQTNAPFANPFYKISVSRGTATISGNLSASQVNPGQTGTANAILTDLYGTIQTIASALNTPSNSQAANAGTNLVPNLAAAFSGTNGVSATGASFITALNSIATDGGNASSLSGLAANINTINGLIFASPSLTTANQSIITTANGANGVTNYTLTGGSLEALQGLNDINNLVSDGLVGTKTTGDTTSYILSANYVNASMALGAKIHGNADTMIQNINIIANNVRNTSTLSAVVTALTNAYGANGQSSPSTAEITALDKLINPGDTTAVKNAWQAIVGAQITPQGAASQSSALAALQSALGAKDTASTLQDALSLQQAVQTLNSAMGTSGGLSGKTNSALQAITTNFASGTAVSVTNSNYLQTLQTALGSSGAISQFNAALSGLKNLVDTANISVNNTQPIATTDTANNSPTNTNSASATTTYPATKATGMGGGSVVNSSQITQSVNNQAAYNAAVNQKLGTLLSNALTYSAQEQALKGLLANSSTISQITSSGINNALADTVYGTSDATNNAASTINIVQAIGYSEELLNAYVSALTGPVNSDPLAQASGLAYLSQALNAPFSSAGLIAQTVKTAQDLLNQTPPATFYQGFETAGQMQAALSTAGIGGVKNTATIAQMTTAMSNLSGLQAALPGVAAGGSAAASIATNVATLEATYQAVAGALNDAAKFEAAATGASAADKLAFTLAKVIATSGSESTYIQNWGTGTNIQNTSVRVNGQTMTLARPSQTSPQPPPRAALCRGF
ncbi:beta strand repeat-containing protein [Helicobacter heilmannii]|uniref:beta strand repeat-containing protein n=1 Tax=Helicobacter heilmannii TaxID=35817 RepID=UPI000CF04A78|nr:hypothetical protein [Helicobacter heilmannii]